MPNKEPGVIDDKFNESGPADHGTLAGLADDDHTQYLLADGTRALAGNWSLGFFTLSNVGTLNNGSGTMVLLAVLDPAFDQLDSIQGRTRRVLHCPSPKTNPEDHQPPHKPVADERNDEQRGEGVGDRRRHFD